MKRRTFISLMGVMAAAGVLSLTGCSSKDTAASTASSATLNKLDSVQKSGKLVVALEGAWQPWSYHDASDTLVGYDVEVSRAIAEKLGVEPEYVESDWDSLFAGLDAGRYDMVCNGVEVTEERAKTYAFTTPYGYIHTALAVRKDNEDIHSFEDLNGKTTFNPELPRWVLVSTGVPHVLFFLLALLSLLRDVVCLIWWLARRLRPGLPALPGSNRQMTALLLVALVMTVMAVPAALRIPDVRTQEIVLPGLPPALDGLRVAQLTDLHISRNFPAEWTRAVVDRTNALRPDIILLTGDLMDGSPALRREDFAPMADLRAPLGVFACPGNHEYYSDLPAWRPVLRAHGITLLENEAAVLPVRGSLLTVAGVTDNVAGRFGLPGPDPHRALEGTPRPRILMAHKPELFHETAPEIDLQLSGHTHGGLALLLDQGVALFNGGFVRGWYARDDARLYVGPGSGLWGGFPLRLGVHSEILLLVLRAPR